MRRKPTSLHWNCTSKDLDQWVSQFSSLYLRESGQNRTCHIKMSFTEAADLKVALTNWLGLSLAT